MGKICLDKNFVLSKCWLRCLADIEVLNWTFSVFDEYSTHSDKRGNLKEDSRFNAMTLLRGDGGEGLSRKIKFSKDLLTKSHDSQTCTMEEEDFVSPESMIKIYLKTVPT